MSQVVDRTKRTPEREIEFLKALATGASVYKAAVAAGVGRRTVYEWREGDDEFATLWDEAVECGTDLFEDEAKRRGVDGVDEPVYYKGEICGHITKYSDALLDKQLRARRKEKYSDRLEQAYSGNLSVGHTHKVSPELAAALEALTGRAPD